MSSVVSKWIFPGIVTVGIGTVAALFFTQTNIQADLVERSSAAISAAGIEQAEISFSGRDGKVSGISTNPDALDGLVTQLSSLHGVRSIVSDITVAPTADPYTFKAVMGDDGSLALSGAVPSFAVRDAILERTGGTDAGLELMSGVPEGDWVATTSFAASRLLEMSSGEASLSNLTLTLSGQARDADSYASATAALTGDLPNNIKLASSDIQPAFLKNYMFSVSQAEGKTTLNGFVPDEATLSAIIDRAGAGATNNLKIAAGAPEHFYEDALVAISAARELGTGSAGYASDSWFLTGQPATIATSAAAQNALITARTNAENWNISLDAAPDTVPYSWSVEKFEGGNIVISGNVPNEATRNAIMARAGAGATDNMVIANGAPDHFYEDALVAVSATKELEEGRAGHGSNGWYLFGSTLTNAGRDAATGALNTARTPSDNWYVSIPEHEEVIVQEETNQGETSQETATIQQSGSTPDIGFEVFHFQGSPMMLSGMVPSNQSRIYLGQVAGGVLTGDLVVSPRGAPENFTENARSGIRSLHRLIEGRLAFEDDQWTLTGIAADAQSRANALDQIKGLANTANWQTDIILPTVLATCQVQVADWAAQSLIEFETGSSQIAPDSLQNLENLADMLTRCPDANVHIEGHTDNQGDFSSNLKQSEERA
ncbi:MAG: OmpA family protein, partial [Devosiaceae bacterium]|nr:OmpA family protein [Devosiaceae bacterium]